MRTMSSAPTEIDTIPASLWPMEGDSSVWRYDPKWEASEKHWLSCARIIPRHSRCDVCGERDLDE